MLCPRLKLLLRFAGSINPEMSLDILPPILHSLFTNKGETR
jgi:hypothetical protein